MQLLQVDLTNYCCHAAKTVVFDSGFVGLVGGNGTGKSSILDAIRFALVGQSVNDGVKKSNIRSNAPARAPSNVRLRLSHAGRTATITRYLRPQSPATIKFDNETTELTGEAEVTACVLAWLGVTDDLLKHVVCAAQEDLFGFANMTSGARAKFFQALFGLDNLQTIRKKVQDFIAAFAVADYDVLLESLQAAIEKSQQALAELDCDENATADAEHAECDLAVAHANKLARVKTLVFEYQDAEKRLAFVTAQGGAEKKVLEADEEALAKAEAALMVMQQTAANVDMLLKLHADAVQQQQAIAGMQTELAKLEQTVLQADTRLQTLKADPLLAGVADPDAQLRLLSQEFAVASAAKTNAVNAYTAYQNTPDVCPTCKQAIHKDSDCVAEMQQELAKAEERYQLVSAQYTALDTVVRAYSQANKAHASLQAEFLYKQNAFKTSQELSAASQVHFLQPEALASVQQAKAQLLQATAAKEAAAVRVENQTQVVQNLRTQFALLQQQKSRVTQSPDYPLVHLYLQDGSGLDEQIVMADHRVVAARQAVQQKLQKIANRQSLANELARLRREYATLSLEKEKQQLVVAKYAKLKEVVELLHADAVPKYIATQNLELLQTEMNRVLQELSAKFRLKAEDDLTLVAMFQDGREQPLSRLSGGQKTVVAAVFRIAMSTMFTNNIGFLVLDEPTAFQDREHIVGLIPALEALERYAENTGMQLLVVTHEPLLHPVFKRLIDLSA